MTAELLDQMKQSIVGDIQFDRKSWRWTELPQIVLLLIVMVGLALVTGFGLYHSISGLRDGASLATAAKAAQVFVTGSSSILGFAVFKLSKHLSELSRKYMNEEKRFTSDINLVRMAPDDASLQKLLKEYYKLK
jgi:hypothetical protein